MLNTCSHPEEKNASKQKPTKGFWVSLPGCLIGVGFWTDGIVSGGGSMWARSQGNYKDAIRDNLEVGVSVAAPGFTQKMARSQ